jgi:hypothetical protein
MYYNNMAHMSELDFFETHGEGYDEPIKIASRGSMTVTKTVPDKAGVFVTQKPLTGFQAIQCRPVLWPFYSKSYVAELKIPADAKVVVPVGGNKLHADGHEGPEVYLGTEEAKVADIYNPFNRSAPGMFMKCKYTPGQNLKVRDLNMNVDDNQVDNAQTNRILFTLDKLNLVSVANQKMLDRLAFS